MKIGLEMFLLVAENMSISLAAQQAFVTQQCVSDHIKRLEKEYNVKLFDRKPKLSLTAAGEVMLENVRSIRVLEKSMSDSLHSMASGKSGSFTLGISTSRAAVILPGVLSQYYKMFPGVNISFCIEDTKILEERLLRGEIDLFIGVNTDPYPDFHIDTMAHDEIKLIISAQLLREHLEESQIEKMSSGVDLNNFTNIPFALSFKTGKVNHVIMEHLNHHHLRLNIVYNISDCEAQIMLCAAGVCASLSPRMLLNTAHRYNLNSNEKNRIYMFPVLDLNRPLNIDMVSHKHVLQPEYIRRFIELTREEVRRISLQ